MTPPPVCEFQKNTVSFRINPLKLMPDDTVYFLYEEYAILDFFSKCHLLPLSRFGQYSVRLALASDSSIKPSND